MAITPKPSRKPAGADIDVEALISKGGSIPERQKVNEDAALVLRIPVTMLQQIQTLLRARPIRTSRHRWILEAVHEKLVRESSNDSTMISQ